MWPFLFYRSLNFGKVENTLQNKFALYRAKNKAKMG